MTNNQKQWEMAQTMLFTAKHALQHRETKMSQRTLPKHRTYFNTDGHGAAAFHSKGIWKFAHKVKHLQWRVVNEQEKISLISISF